MGTFDPKVPGDLMYFYYLQSSLSFHGRCTVVDDNFKYSITLQRNSEEVLEQRMISHESCSDGLCDTTFNVSVLNRYQVSISASNTLGMSDSSFASIGMMFSNFVITPNE